jgi:hypothetical protein
MKVGEGNARESITVLVIWNRTEGKWIRNARENTRIHL